MTNALEALLGAKPVTEITDTVYMERFGTDFTVKALSTDDVQRLKEEATYYTGNGKSREAKINEDQLSLLLIVEATVDPNFSDKALMTHYDAKTPSQCVQKALLPGEFGKLTEAVLRISGLAAPTEEEIEEVKN